MSLPSHSGLYRKSTEIKDDTIARENFVEENFMQENFPKENFAISFENKHYVV